MIIGENARSEDLDVNPVKEKHLTNMRSSTADVLVRLDTHHRPTLDEALEFVREDEAVEVTPVSVRMRKVVLSKVERLKAVRIGAQVSIAASAGELDGGASEIQLSGLVKSFHGPDGPIRAVRGVDVRIAAGETVALLGPNGAGKSTTIDMLLGLLAPDEGTVSVLRPSTPRGSRAGGRSARCCRPAR